MATNENNSPLPPGPRSRFVSTIRQGVDTGAALIDWSERYGATFTVRDVTGTTIVTGDQELIKQVFTADIGLFQNVLDTFDVIFGPKSLVFQFGTDHLDTRKLMSPTMGRSAASRWMPTIEKLAHTAFDELPLNTTIGFFEPLKQLAMRVVARVVHGARTQEEEEQLTTLGMGVVRGAHPSFILSRQAQREFGGLSPFSRFRVARDAWDEAIRPHIQRARADSEERFDVLSMLSRARYADGRGMSDDELRDNMLMLMLAAQEAIAAASAWMLYFIHRDPEVHSRALVELHDPDSPDEVHQLSYLGAVFDETLRLRPPGPQAFRRLRVPWRLGPWELPAGVTISPAIILLHTNPKLWDQPELFRPERFLVRRPGPYQYLPFGGGHYRCLGAMLAKTAVMGIVAAVLRRHEFELVGDDPIPVTRVGFTFGPGAEINLRAIGLVEPAVDRSRTDLRMLESGVRQPFRKGRPEDSLIDLKIFTSAASHTTMRVVRVAGAALSRTDGVVMHREIENTGPLNYEFAEGGPRPIMIDDSSALSLPDDDDDDD